MYYYCLSYVFLLFCMFCFHRANWNSSATLTEVFPCVFLSCKATARVYLSKTGHGPHSSQLVKCVVLCVACVDCVVLCIFVCKCVLYYCHRVSTQLQLTNISYSWFQAFAVFYMLYAFFWVITRHLEIRCRRFGTLCSIFMCR
jgi:hypothetical protein